MSDPKSQADPPMEEILATVRRIIAEDESGTSTPSGASTASVASTPAADANKPGAKRVVVTVTYDETGRVTQASGGDANALRIARQKRFPTGKAGSATISIPLN